MEKWLQIKYSDDSAYEVKASYIADDYAMSKISKARFLYMGDPRKIADAYEKHYKFAYNDNGILSIWLKSHIKLDDIADYLILVSEKSALRVIQGTSVIER